MQVKAANIKTSKACAVINAHALGGLIGKLKKQGYQVIGPRVKDGAVVYEPISAPNDLPHGIIESQQPGSYRLQKPQGKHQAGFFDFTLGAHSWKRFLFPPVQQLFKARRDASGFAMAVPDEAPRMAFIGVRACEIKAMQIQDRVFMAGSNSVPDYQARRQKAFIVAVNCRRAGDACFCVSMDAGPKVKDGFDIALSELGSNGEFLAEAGSSRGLKLLAGLPSRKASQADLKKASNASAKTALAMKRKMPKKVRAILLDNLKSPRWDEIAKRCTSCGNCTMVCPTCFCSAISDQTSLDGQTAARTRRWDSCFALDFSYLHGGALRQSAGARFRQWMTHKLAHWHDQFDSSGCTGCGRCIVWCPAGIDIVKEARSFKDGKR